MILLTGGLGQIGTELISALNIRHGVENVVVTDLQDSPNIENRYHKLDVRDREGLRELFAKENITQIYHMAALLSATGEKNPGLCWDVNMNGTINILEFALEKKAQVYLPSSIAVWGKQVERQNTPQDSVLYPTTMYGVTKASGEILADYYYTKHGLDVRGLRYPGIISNKTLPGGGTTDYAVDIFYQAVKTGSYECFLRENTTLPMMYMPDCIKATLDLMDADGSNLVNRTNFNVTAFSFSPDELYQEIKKHILDFEISYSPDYRQAIADNWPQTVNDSAAREQWGWRPEYDTESMVKDMIEVLKNKHQNGQI
ncbi:MAG: L-threonine 3-dehydrogenase [Candidatus Kapaibacteriales bacterium]